MTTSSIVSKVWSFCNPLRDVGVGYGDYLEQLTYLLFLKMADEYSKPPYNRALNIPAAYNWESLTGVKGAELDLLYATLLRELSTQKGILGQIFTKSQNKIQDPAMLAKIIDMIITRDKTSLDITWLKDKSLADLDNLPDPEDLASDIIENLEAGLASFREIMVKIGK